MPCRIGGCANTWTWFAAQQIRGFGQKPPERMCDQHLAQFSELADREIPCRTPGCANTWLWKRGAQLADLQRHGRLKRPARLCQECLNAERDTHDVDMPCKVEGCRRGWVWSRDAQLRHRLWVLRQRSKARAAEARAARADEAAEQAVPEVLAAAPAAPEALSPEPAAPEALSPAPAGDAPGEAAPEALSSAPAEGEGEAEGAAAEPGGDAGGHKKRRRRKRKPQRVRELPDPEGPPQRMCGLCAQKLGRIAAKDVPCKVHGCVRTWTWDRASQLRAWVLSGSDDVDFEPAAPKRMCEVCREFCRKHPDRDVHCGRPGCGNTWSFKTGAQLQAFLAGRLHDPLKLCPECAKGEFAKEAEAAGLPEGAEIMPCVVPACSGTWVYIPGQRLAPVVEGEHSPDRMCGKCRRERGFPAPEHDTAPAELEVSPDDTEEPEHDEILADEPEPSHEHDDAAHDDAAHDDAAHDDAAHDDDQAAPDEGPPAPE